jgi:sugar diacid utilization regulator
MYNFNGFLQNLCSSSGLKFNLIGEDGSTIFTSLQDDKIERVYFPIVLGKQKAVIDISKEYELCKSLLKYTIESKYKELFSIREQFFIDILEGKDVVSDMIKPNLPFLSKGCTLYVISLEGNRCEALSIVRQLYDNQDIMSVLYKDNLVVLGEFDEINEHAESIRDSIVSELYCKCVVSYGMKIYDVVSIKKSYEEAKECVSLGKNFHIKNEIFSYNKMIFEKLVYNIKPQIKQELLQSFEDKLNAFDSEMINTIEEFVNCGLNISDAAKKLYVHRNTLIYRLDKIYKETNFDIRNFKDAAVFAMAFLIWKENK